MLYRNLHRYKYQLMRTEIFQTGIIPVERTETVDRWVTLHLDGQIVISRGYAWDGPSGPAIDTKNFLRASLIHDALYQMMRAGLLDIKYRETADRILREVCLKDGMSRIRAWWVYRAVRAFAGPFAKPDREEIKILEAP